MFTGLETRDVNLCRKAATLTTAPSQPRHLQWCHVDCQRESWGLITSKTECRGGKHLVRWPPRTLRVLWPAGPSSWERPAIPAALLHQGKCFLFECSICVCEVNRLRAANSLHRLLCGWDRGLRQCLSRPALLFCLLKLSKVQVCPAKGHKTH